jgi:hypothetical protein
VWNEAAIFVGDARNFFGVQVSCITTTS